MSGKGIGIVGFALLQQKVKHLLQSHVTSCRGVKQRTDQPGSSNTWRVLSTDFAPTAAGEGWDTAVKPKLRLLLASWLGYECMLPTLVRCNSFQSKSSRQSDIRTSNMTLQKVHERVSVRHGHLTSELTGMHVRR